MKNQIERPKIAFYPCCETDFVQPIDILNEMVSTIIFCDIVDFSMRMHGAFTRFRRGHPDVSLPRVLFFPMDMRLALNAIRSIDVLFYRGDSFGEGGSELPILSSPLLEMVLSKFPDSGGVILTDGSNSDVRLGRWPKISTWTENIYIGDPRGWEYYCLEKSKLQSWRNLHLISIDVKRLFRPERP